MTLKPLLRFILSITLSLSLLIAYMPAFSLAATTNTSEDNYVSDEVIIKLKPNANIQSIMNKHSLKMYKKDDKLKVQKLKIKKSKKVKDQLSELAKDKNIEYAQPNYKYTTNLTPNDPQYSSQWGLPRIKADLAWNASLGNNSVIIAIIDTGADLTHADLANNLVTGYNAITNTTGNTNDDNGHGSHVSGIAAGIINNATGITGVSGKSKIMPVKVLDSSGSGYTSDIAEGIIWASDHGAKVINMSLGGSSYDQYLQDAINYANSKGITVIAAAGNSNTSSPSYPAALNNVISVAAIDQNNGRAYFSNYGSTIDLAAPGVNILSTYMSGSYKTMSGTSMASPFVAGAAAFLLSLNNKLTPSEIEFCLETNTLDLGIHGKDTYFGYGLINIQSALNAIVPSISLTNTPTPTLSFIPTSTPKPTSTPTTINTPSPTNIPRKTASISYYLGEEAIVTTTIHDSKDNLVITLEENVVKPAGLNFVKWDGRDSMGNVVGDGIYYYKLTATDSSGETFVTTGKITIERLNPYITKVTDSPDPFIATGSNFNTINFTISEDATVKIIILDNNNYEIKTLINEYMFKGNNKVSWDGRDNNANIVSQGTYTYTINATDGFNKVANQITGIITLINPTPTNSVPIAEPTVTPTQIPIETIVVPSQTSTPVPTSNQLPTSKPITMPTFYPTPTPTVFPQDSLTPTVLPGQVPTYVLTETPSPEQTNFPTPSATPTLMITYYPTPYVTPLNPTATLSPSLTSTPTIEPFLLSDPNFDPNPFSPYGSNSGTLTYKVSKDAKVTSSIYNKSGQLVITLENDKLVCKDLSSVIWNGKNSNGNLVNDGTYIYRINATDLSGTETSEASGTILVDTLIPVISSIEDSPDPFNVNGINKSTISYKLSEDVYVTIKIFDSTQNLVSTIFEGYQSAGNTEVIWAGTNTNNGLVADGIYTYAINATDSLNNHAQPALGTITTYRSKNIVDSGTFSPITFSPDGITTGTLTYSLKENANVSIKIYDSLGNTVKEIISQTNEAIGSHSQLWDGTNSNQIIVTDGTYKFEIIASTATNETDVETGEVIIDSKNPIITIVGDSPDPLMPDGQIVNTIEYLLSEKSTVRVNINDSAGNTIRRLFEGLQLAGTNKISWNGTNDNGEIVYDGVYTYTINAYDSLYKPSIEVSGTITIDKTAPVISTTNFMPIPYKLYQAANGILTYNLSENSRVTIVIYDNMQNQIKILEKSAPELIQSSSQGYYNGQSFLANISNDLNSIKNAGVNTVAWNGTDSANNPVSTGIYRYKIDALDLAGISAAPITGSISVIASSSEPIPTIVITPTPVNATITPSPLTPTVTPVWEVPTTTPVSEIPTATPAPSSPTTSPIPRVPTTTPIIPDDTSPTPDPFIISAVDDTPDPLVTDGLSVSTISYTINRDAKVTIKVYDPKGILVRTLMDTQVLKGSGNTSWNGKNSKGTLVYDGIYTYKVDALDLYGNKAPQVTGSLFVDSTKLPLISQHYVDPTIFAPDN